MIECVKCGARAQVHLCTTCTHWLRHQLLGMPTLLGHLEDSALGMTKLGARQPGGSTKWFESFTPTLDRRAVTLIQEIESTLGQWANDFARTYGFEISAPVHWRRPIQDYRPVASDHATFLAAHVRELVKDYPDVGELCQELRHYAARGMVIINRPVEPQFCGPCPAIISDHRHCAKGADGAPHCGRHRHACATSLMAPRGSLEVTCGTCGALHVVEKLINHLLSSADDYRCTIPELHRVLRMLNESVSEKTLYRWASPKVGLLKPSGYIRPDSMRIALTRHGDGDRPVYRVSDARRLREKSLQPGRRGRPLKK